MSKKLTFEWVTQALDMGGSVLMVLLCLPLAVVVLPFFLLGLAGRACEWAWRAARR